MSITSKSAIQLFAERLRARSRLNDAETDAVMALKGHVAVAHANVDIVSPGELVDHACLIVDGLAARFGQALDGRRQITAFHIAGDMCDLHSVVLPRVSWALQALSTTAVLKIAHRDLRAVAQAFPNVAEAFWRECSVDASVLSQWVVNVGQREAVPRLAHLLCEMAVRMETNGLGKRTAFRLEASQAQLGDALGLTSVHVNRTLRVLRESGAMSLVSREVRIDDWPRLVAIGDFDEAYLQISAQPEGRIGSEMVGR